MEEKPAQSTTKVRVGGNRKLNRNSVSEIKLQIASGASITRLARAYGVKYQTLYRIARGETWTDVEPRGNLIQRERPQRVMDRETREKCYRLKRKRGLSNRALSERVGVSESVMARAMRDSELVLAFRVQRLLLTSGGHKIAMEEFRLDLKEAERLTAIATGSRIPKHLKGELE